MIKCNFSRFFSLSPFLQFCCRLIFNLFYTINYCLFVFILFHIVFFYYSLNVFALLCMFIYIISTENKYTNPIIIIIILIYELTLGCSLLKKKKKKKKKKNNMDDIAICYK